MKKIRVMTVVGTRPEIIRLSSVIRRLDESEAIDHILVHTGQNYDYELNEIFFRDLGLRKPDYYLDGAGTTPMETIGQILIAVEPVLDEIRPDAFLVLGDTNSCLCALAAKRKHIPVFHMEAGNRCFDQRVPEEINRRIVDHLADINLTYSDIAREYLLREGLPPDRVIKIGSPMLEVLQSRRDAVNGSSVLTELGLEEKGYFVVSAHREENVDSEETFTDLVNSLNAIAMQEKKPIIFSAHPRTRNRIEDRKIQFNPLIRTIKPLGYIDYIHLQMKAIAVLSDSGTISEESSLLGFPALNLRQSHERPEAMEEAAVMMVGLGAKRILQGLEVLKGQQGDTLKQVADYQADNVSEKVLRIILSYTDYINRVVWGVMK